MGSRNSAGWLVLDGERVVSIENTRAEAYQSARMLNMFSDRKYTVRKGM